MNRLLNKVMLIVEAHSNIGMVIALQHDVNSRDSWKNIFFDIISNYGKIDILFNNAGISSPKMLLDLSAQDCWNIQAIDINSYACGLNEMIPFMVKNGGGSIINIS